MVICDSSQPILSADSTNTQSHPNSQWGIISWQLILSLCWSFILLLLLTQVAAFPPPPQPPPAVLCRRMLCKLFLNNGWFCAMVSYLWKYMSTGVFFIRFPAACLTCYFIEGASLRAASSPSNTTIICCNKCFYILWCISNWISGCN